MKYLIVIIVTCVLRLFILFFAILEKDLHGGK
jgi:hypothetical protein